MKLKLPPGPFNAYLFDCDGTIADSMPLHYLSWKKALAEWNCEFAEDLFYAWGGMPIAEIIATLNERQGLTMPVETVALRKESLFLELHPQIKPVPEVLEHIEAAHGRIPFCRLRKHAGVGNRFSHLAPSPRSIRYVGLRGRLPEEQT